MRTLRSHSLILFTLCSLNYIFAVTPPADPSQKHGGTPKKDSSGETSDIRKSQGELIDKAVGQIGSCGKKSESNFKPEGTLTWYLKRPAYMAVSNYISVNADKPEADREVPYSVDEYKNFFAKRITKKKYSELKGDEAAKGLVAFIDKLAAFYANAYAVAYDYMKGKSSDDIKKEIIGSTEQAKSPEGQAKQRLSNLNLLAKIDGSGAALAQSLVDAEPALVAWVTKGCKKEDGTDKYEEGKTEDVASEVDSAESGRAAKREFNNEMKDSSLAGRSDVPARNKMADLEAKHQEFSQRLAAAGDDKAKQEEAKNWYRSELEKTKGGSSDPVKKDIDGLIAKFAPQESNLQKANATTTSDPNAIKPEQVLKAKSFLTNEDVREQIKGVSTVFPDAQNITDEGISRLLSKSPNPPLTPEESSLATTLKDHLGGVSSIRKLQASQQNRKKIAEDILTQAGIPLNAANEQQRRSLADRVDGQIEKEKASLVKMKADDPMLDIYGTELNPEYAQAEARVQALEQYRDQHLVKARNDQIKFDDNKTRRLSSIEAADKEVVKLTSVPKAEMTALVSAYAAARPKAAASTTTVLKGYEKDGEKYFKDFQVGRLLVDEKTGVKTQKELEEFRSVYAKSAELKYKWSELYRTSVANNSPLYQSMAKVQGGSASATAPSLEDIFTFLLKNPKDPLRQ